MRFNNSCRRLEHSYTVRFHINEYLDHTREFCCRHFPYQIKSKAQHTRLL